MNKFDENFIFENPSSIAIGNFDGMHLGHQTLLKNYSQNLKKYVLTFNFLFKEKHSDQTFLTSLEDKEYLAKLYGADELLYLNFDETLKNTTADDFIKEYLDKPNIKEIIVGKDFRFGKFGQKNAQYLKEKLKDKSIKIIDLLDDKDGHKISTTEIISLLKEKKVEQVSSLLGRNYLIKGYIEQGLRNGHKIGFPTANIKTIYNYTLPGNGVYATNMIIDGHKYLSMTNIGTHPTISELKKPLVETHIFNFNEEIYNKKIELEFLCFIRPEKKFDSIDDLKKELQNNKNKIIKTYEKNY